MVDRRRPSRADTAGGAASTANRGEVLERLHELIQNGGYAAGEKLPPERALAVKLGVGRPAVREAIKALGILGVIESRRGAGTFVLQVRGGHARWPDHPNPEGASFELLDLLEARKMFEPRAAWLAAARATERDLREIEAARRALEASGDDWRKIADGDLRLHAAIIHAAGNSVLTWIHHSLTPMMRKSRSITARSAPDRSRMHRDHTLIVESIVKGQPDEAEKAMLEHLHTIGMDLIATPQPESREPKRAGRTG